MTTEEYLWQAQSTVRAQNLDDLLRQVALALAMVKLAEGAAKQVANPAKEV